MSMDRQDILRTQKITSEYINFMRKTQDLIEEAKRATVLALQKVLELEEGDVILIKDDGSLEIEAARSKGVK